jgi:ubiquinone/menaquinone biosynthesis C-methylase UbiE
MNLKLLITTYRNRYRFIKDSVIKYSGDGKFDQVLNLGSGEGDYDAMIAAYGQNMHACDINDQDVAFARNLNAEVENLSYEVENALALTYGNNSFDLITSVDVIEHVGEPEKMLDEIQRILKPGGMLFITFPSVNFPFTYDPVNRVLSYFGDKKIPQGAYAFGHEYLIDPIVFKSWMKDRGFEVVEEISLGGYLVGLLEMYWTGLIQKIFKTNATNDNLEENQTMKLRPSTKEPFLVKLVDAVNWIDRLLFSKFHASIGKGFVMKKN